MQCPRCAAELPTWPRRCEACGLELASAPPLEPPPDLGPVPREAPAAHAALPAPGPPPRDFRTHLIVAGILAFVSTLLPFLGILATALGLWVLPRAHGAQRRLALLAACAGMLGLAVGVGIYLAACDLPNLRDVCVAG